MLNALFEPLQLGELALSNRVIMAPMTRSRGEVPTGPHVEYYRQRAGAGLIVAEGTFPSPHGQGYCRTPGIYTAAQVDGWRRVTEAVHQAGGKIVLQLMHVGRIASHHNKAPDAETVAPSALRARGKIYADNCGMVDFDMPRALQSQEIAGVVEEYRQATANAISAGFDGVELHCASGYLPMQFLSSASNLRSDGYGGSLHKRLRFVVEVLEAMVGVAGAGRVGLRICPGNPFNDMHDDDPVVTYSALLDAVSPLQTAYLHVIRSPLAELDAFALARRHFRGPLIINDGFDDVSARSAVSHGLGEAVSFGRHFIANPDLVQRFRSKAPLAVFDKATLYTPGARGYTDYQALSST